MPPVRVLSAGKVLLNLCTATSQVNAARAPAGCPWEHLGMDFRPGLLGVALGEGAAVSLVSHSWGKIWAKSECWLDPKGRELTGFV